MTKFFKPLVCRRMVLFFGSMLFASCATLKLQQSDEIVNKNSGKEPSYTFFIAGGMGNISAMDNSPILESLGNQLSQASENSTLIFTGDNVTDGTDSWDLDRQLLDKHIGLTKNYKGSTILIPGNNEWKSENVENIEEFENYIKDLNLESVDFFPENACPIERIELSDKLILILVDSNWFVSNWSKVKNINKKCTDIVTRQRFVQELEDAIDDNLDKNIVIAMHHPVFSNGQYAGHKTFGDHMKPLPVLGTLNEGLKDLAAFDPEHLNSRRYNYLRVFVTTQAQKSERITIVSGHEENLQYLVAKNVRQIISGALASKSATYLSKDELVSLGGSLPFEGKFAHGTLGYAKLEYFKDGSSQTTFYSFDGDENTTTMDVLPKFPEKKPIIKIDSDLPKEVSEKVLDDPDAYYKSGFYEFLWGERYRSYFGKKVTAPTVNLDTLYGGVKVTKEGGGHQSFSLRLEDKDGGEYAMRSLRKSALKFLKFKLPGIAYNEDKYRDSWPEELVSDFFSTAHPFMQLVVDPLARAVEVNHSDTKLYYVPKQETLGDFNEEYGDELYFIERRPSEEQENYKGYRRTIDENGKVTDIESTTGMLEKIKEDEEYVVDQKAYIRARIFDMLIGDWDRHQDQWRWVEYEGEDGIKEFMPIPRDRDNIFPRFDGFALKLIKLFVPNSRRWQTFDDDIDDIKWLNLSGSQLDKVLVTNLGIESWVEEAKYIQSNLGEQEIEDAFKYLPMEVRDSVSDFIKESLKLRLEKLDDWALAYGTYLNKVVIVRGTEKDDKFEFARQDDGKTIVVVNRILSDEPDQEIYRRTLDKSTTHEVWAYGLGDDDVFEITGDGDKYIKIKIVGGYGRDQYHIQNKKKVTVYDWKHEESDFKKEKPKTQLTNLYQSNTLHWKYFTPNNNILAPNLGFRSDDNVFLGLTERYTKNGLNGAPYKQQHTFRANYYFSFGAFELQYDGVFANVVPGWNFETGAYYSNDRYVKNFFGYGNETVNQENQLDIDFYRGRVRQFKSYVGLAYYHLRPRLIFESYEVKQMDDRFFNLQNLNPEAFASQNYIGAEVTGHYDRDNAGDFPTKAMYFGLTVGYKANLGIEENRFGYASVKAGFDHKLIPSGDLVFSTIAEYRANIGDNEYFFYHAPSIGGDNGLRGFRDQRFTGRSYFYQNTDLKFRIKEYVTAFTPVTFGVFGGFDYGRVWVQNDTSHTWHTSQGGGLWIGSLKELTLKLGYFNSKENNLFQVSLSVPF
ncbi:metallophosphoesterase [Muricauda brasiliensis]|uniref:metallophosphoesterase n=1 Tax=Muricauda brasiliensis TaxID=2162892 RepID=UPI001F24F1FF|nr:metallophosphoesterase [Muricauda brasiliensis]